MNMRGTMKIFCMIWAVLIPVMMITLLFPLCDAAAEDPHSLNIALYPYVPDLERFEQAIREQWDRVHPEVELNFVSWDCYSEDPRDDLDLFVYDSIFLYDFLEKGSLLPLSETDIYDAADLVPAALSACSADGVLYAVPQLLCTNLLFGREGDAEIADAKNISELYQVVGNDIDDAVPPAANDKLLVSIPDTLELAFWYMETRIDLDQGFSEWVPIPEADNLDPDVLDVLYDIQTMAGSRQMTYADPGNNLYIRGSWFADGRGRAMIGFSENMHAMGRAAENVTFHRISLSDEEDIPMLYADLASINAGIDESKKPLALELLNILTGKEMLISAFSAAGKDPYPQYLLSARLSVYDALAEAYPVYGELKGVVSDPRCQVFVVRPGGKDLLEKARNALTLPIPADPLP